MVSALVQVQTLAREILLSFLRKTLNSHSASVHPDVYMGTSECNAGSNTPMDLHPGKRRNIPSRFMLQKPCWPEEPLGSYADVTLGDMIL